MSDGFAGIDINDYRLTWEGQALVIDVPHVEDAPHWHRQAVFDDRFRKLTVRADAIEIFLSDFPVKKESLPETIRLREANSNQVTRETDLTWYSVS